MAYVTSLLANYSGKFLIVRDEPRTSYREVVVYIPPNLKAVNCRVVDKRYFGLKQKNKMLQYVLSVNKRIIFLMHRMLKDDATLFRL